MLADVCVCVGVYECLQRVCVRVSEELEGDKNGV